MTNIIEINGKRYPFLFSMDVVWFLQGSGKIDFEESGEGEEKQTKVIADYNSLIELFIIANESAVEYEGKGETLTPKDLRNGIRKNPKLFIDLQNKLGDSEVFKILESMADEKDEDKKKT